MMKRIFACSIICCFIITVYAPSAADTFDSQRQRVHAKRKRLYTQAEQATSNINEQYLQDLTGLGEQCIDAGAPDILRSIIQAVKDVGESHSSVQTFTKALETIENTASSGKIERLKYKLTKIEQSRSKKRITLADRCFKAGLVGTAYDIALEEFKRYPENEDLRELFGYYKGGDTWFRKYGYKMFKKGYIWDEELAWIRTGHEKVYKNGKFILNGRVVDLEDANNFHKKRTNPWVITSEHFIVTSNMDRKKVVALTSRLESFYRKFFRYYVGFFNFGRRQVMDTLFKMEQAKKFNVYYWRDKEDYMAHARTLGNFNFALLEHSAGFYSSRTGTSQFFDCKQVNSILYHEVTHQILGEYGVKSRKAKPIWIVEGAAVSSECVKNEGDFNVSFNPRTNTRLQYLKQKHPNNNIFDFMGITHDEFHGSNRMVNYCLAGAIVTFFLEYDNAAYREDFTDYLRDVYMEKVDWNTITVDRYIQKSREQLQKEFDAFLKAIPAVEGVQYE